MLGTEEAQVKAPVLTAKNVCRPSLWEVRLAHKCPRTKTSGSWRNVSAGQARVPHPQACLQTPPQAHMYLKAIVSLDWILCDIVTRRQVNFPVQVSRLQRESKSQHLDKRISMLALFLMGTYTDE